MPQMPRVEPLAFDRLSAGDAQFINTRTPFASSVGDTSRPFALRGDRASQARAADCLAVAMLFEAGGDALGQRAVGQVVLNRVRHAAFPATVCGVVFQGSERATGCQFTFTCDGALARRPAVQALAIARARAWELLEGSVVNQVGLATHYHTDWVHPTWSAQMDKLAAVQTHLFFRWHGSWGSRQAFTKLYQGDEPVVPALAVLSEAHRKAGGQEVLQPSGTIRPDGLAADSSSHELTEAMSKVRGGGALGPTIVINMLPGGDGSKQSFQAFGRCEGRVTCRVEGHIGDNATVAFLYVRDRREKWLEVMLWNCTIFPRSKGDECLGAGNQHWASYAG